MPSPAARTSRQPPPGHRTASPDTADAVVVGGGTVGAWCAYFLRRSGLERVIVLEKRTLGQGASSRAAGIVRTQGGTPWAVRLGDWSRQVLPEPARRARHRLRLHPAGLPAALLHPARMSGRPAPGWPCRTPRACLSAGWSPPSSTRPARRWRRDLPSAARTAPRTATSTPPRNVTAYAVALATVGVQVREHVTFTGLRTAGDRVTGVADQRGADRRPDRGPDRRPRAGRGRQAGRHPDRGRRGPAPGRGDRAASRSRRQPAADGLRPVRRAVLAPGGRRHAVRHEQPGRAARRGEPASTSLTWR